MRRALEQAGTPESAIVAHLAGLPVAADETVDLDEADEGQTAALFLALDGSWHRAGLDGARVGLMASEIGPTAGLLGIEVDRAMFVDLRRMEAEALRIFASQRR